MDLKEMRQSYINDGYEPLDASSKVCQDILLAKISKSSLNRNITIKGGVVMQSISKDNRRATRDLDLDFIKYSLDDKSIRNFIGKLKSLLKFGFVSTRYKDIFDFYYLINNENLDKDKLLKCFDILVFKDEKMKENNIDAIFRRLHRILHNKNYLKSLNTAKNNWLELPINDVVQNVLHFFESFQFVEI